MGCPKVLDLHRSVLLTLVLLRQNLSQTVAGDWFDVSQPTVSRIFRRIARSSARSPAPHATPNRSTAHTTPPPTSALPATHHARLRPTITTTPSTHRPPRPRTDTQ
ncbi:transposase family protein [Saccharothrix sp. ALI-22-I]|uniref:transposase family protein n=1 Tax=Saccharothrix sp. ALI-22-I TaxID=1933778 RepID=UPI003FD2E6E2